MLYQNDDYGKDCAEGPQGRARRQDRTMIVAEMPYETADPDRRLRRSCALKASGADIFVNITTPKFAAQAIKKVAELGWKPVHILNNVAGSIGVGAEAGRAWRTAKGILTTGYLKDPTDPRMARRSGHEGAGPPSWTKTIRRTYTITRAR